MTKTHVATIRGTFLAPGVSSNGRLYTKENIAKAVNRMQAAIADGSAPPITQLTSHGTDDVLQTVGRLTRVWQDESGLGKYESEAPDTTNGRDMAVLAKHGYIKNVSISGRWLGDVKNVEHEGQEAETADDLEVVRVDYVPRPGVSAARIDDVALAEGAPLGDWRDEMKTDTQISEGACPTCGHLEAAIPANKETFVTEEAKTNPEETKGGLSESDVVKIGEAVSKSNADLVAQLVAAMKPAPVVEAAPVVTEAPAAPALAETEEQRFARFFEARKAELVQQIVKENGLPSRHGVVADVQVEAKALHEMSPMELRKASVEVAEALIQPGVVYPGVHRED